MASIIERKRVGKPSTWQVIVRVKGHKPIARTFETPEQARAFGEGLEKEVRTVVKREHKAVELSRKANPTQADYNEKELRSVLRLFVLSDESIARDGKSLPTILANVGDIRLGDIKKAWAKAYIEKLRKKKTRAKKQFTYATLAVHFQIMRKACLWQAEELELPSPTLPFSTAIFPSGWENKRERRLDIEEERAIMARLRRIKSPAKYHWRLLVKLALETGARLQELVKSEWRNVDIRRATWTIPAADTKTNTTRTVPMSKKCVRIFKALRLLADEHEARVFHALGKPGPVSSGFHKFVLDAGVVDFRFHDLRHEAISRMVLYKRKMRTFEIMKIVGHSNSEMLVRYANLRGDELAQRMD
jgi:integrase